MRWRGCEEPKIKDRIVEVRGAGLFIGIELKQTPEQFVEKAARTGVIANVTAQKVIRIAPPINVPRIYWIADWIF